MSTMQAVAVVLSPTHGAKACYGAAHRAPRRLAEQSAYGWYTPSARATAAALQADEHRPTAAIATAVALQADEHRPTAVCSRHHAAVL